MPPPGPRRLSREGVGPCWRRQAGPSGEHSPNHPTHPHTCSAHTPTRHQSHHTPPHAHGSTSNCPTSLQRSEFLLSWAAVTLPKFKMAALLDCRNRALLRLNIEAILRCRGLTQRQSCVAVVLHCGSHRLPQFKTAAILRCRGFALRHSQVAAI